MVWRRRWHDLQQHVNLEKISSDAQGSISKIRNDADCSTGLAHNVDRSFAYIWNSLGRLARQQPRNHCLECKEDWPGSSSQSEESGLLSECTATQPYPRCSNAGCMEVSPDI